MKRGVALLLTLYSAVVWTQRPPTPRIDMPLHDRLQLHQGVSSVSLLLTDFVGFIATSYKVPILAEVTCPQPDVTITAGSYTARQLLDQAVSQLHEYRWKSENGVAHLYQSQLRRAGGTC